jgi:hypothetical protein
MGLGITIGAGLVPDAELTALASEVVVKQSLGRTTRYSVVFPIDFSAGDVPFLSDGRIAPGSDLMIVAPDGATVLARGPVHSHRIGLVTGGEGSSLEVVGSDVSVKLDREARIAAWPNVTDAEAAMAIMGQNLLTPDAMPTDSRHVMTQHPLIQRGSDLAFLRMLARRNGYLFWVTSEVAGIDIGHFKPAPVDAPPVATLSLKDRDAALSRLEIHWDVERPTSAEAFGLDLANKSALQGSAPQSPLSAMGDRPLAAIATETRKALPVGVANDTAGLTGLAEGVLAQEGFFVTATCATTPEAAGGVIQAHETVTIDGAGAVHSGSYLVGVALHRIGSTAHQMELTLLRNAWGQAWSLT